MNENYYCFTKLEKDRDTINFFNSLSNEKLINIMDLYFDSIDKEINNLGNVFKNLFKGNDYDEFYYLCKSLSEELNDIKIIINILGERNE